MCSQAYPCFFHCPPHREAVNSDEPAMGNTHVANMAEYFAEPAKRKYVRLRNTSLTESDKLVTNKAFGTRDPPHKEKPSFKTIELHTKSQHTSFTYTTERGGGRDRGGNRTVHGKEEDTRIAKGRKKMRGERDKKN